MRHVSVALGAGLALLAAAPAMADEWADQVQQYMDTAAARLAESGYHYGGYSHDGSIDDNGSETLTVRLGAGMTSHLVGQCDNDCTDLDLVLYDPSGNQVSSDVAVDDYPVVTVTPSKDGAYTVEVQMIACSTNPCRYAIQQFVK